MKVKMEPRIKVKYRVHDGIRFLGFDHDSYEEAEKMIQNHWMPYYVNCGGEMLPRDKFTIYKITTTTTIEHVDN